MCVCVFKRRIGEEMHILFTLLYAVGRVYRTSVYACSAAAGLSVLAASVKSMRVNTGDVLTHRDGSMLSRAKSITADAGK